MIRGKLPGVQCARFLFDEVVLLVVAIFRWINLLELSLTGGTPIRNDRRQRKLRYD